MTEAVAARMDAEGLEFAGMMHTKIGGPCDGEKFFLVSDGQGCFWISDSRPGQFHLAFVPAGFTHPEVIT
jgi:hypothetical protein